MMNFGTRMMRASRRFLFAYAGAVLLIFWPMDDSRADTLRLKDGTLYRDVVVILVSGEAAIVFKGGRVRFVKLKNIRWLRHEKVRWKRRTPKPSKLFAVPDRVAMANRLRKVIRAKKAERERNLRRIREKHRDAFWRSMIWPGWGQQYMGEPQRGRWYMGIAGLLAVNLAVSVRSFNAARADYRETPAIPGSPGVSNLALNFLLLDSNRQALARADSRRSMAFGVLAAFWLWNLADLFVFPPSELPDLEPASIKVGLGPAEPGQAAVGFRVQFRF